MKDRFNAQNGNSRRSRRTPEDYTSKVMDRLRTPLIAGIVVLLLVGGGLYVARDGGGDVVLEGAWFVLYQDDPRPYLDVEFSGGTPTEVTAWLRAPDGTEHEFALFWNDDDGEWQCDCTSLPALDPGTWWIPRVRADVTTWTSPSVYDPYAGTEVDAGFFFVPAPGGERVVVRTLPVEGRPVADTLIRVFPEDDLGRWIVAADDPITTSPLAVLDAPLPPGRYVLRVDGSDDAGHYVIVRGDPGGIPPVADESEPDGPERATALVEGVAHHRSVGGGDHSDWYTLEVP